MAAEALKKLEDQLNCPICLDVYTDPKLLQCFHIYCRQCLVPLVDRGEQGKLGLACPTCRQVTPIPERGVTGLPPAFHISHLLEIQESLQKPIAIQEAVVTVTAPTGAKKVSCCSCSVHEGKELELYCDTCGELICWRCVAKVGTHHDHDYDELAPAFEKYKAEITSLLEPMEKQVTTTEKALAQMDSSRKEISHQRDTIESSIEVTFEQLQEVLNARKTELIGQLDVLSEGKLKGLAAQMDLTDSKLTQLKNCLHFSKESLKTENEGDVLMMKTNTVEKVKVLTSLFQPDILKPITQADIVFSSSSDATAVCQGYGRVLTEHGLPDPSKCHATGMGAEMAMVGENSMAILHVVSFEDEVCVEPVKSLECEFVSMITGAMATRHGVSAERKGKSQYEITYQPTVKGRHQLHVKAEGQHIRGSPFTVAVKSSVEKLGSPILTISGVRTPCGVAIAQNGEVVVSELGKHCMSMFGTSGEKLKSFGSYGALQGEFGGPRGVAVDCEGNILVADSWNRRIQKFTAEGQFVAAVGTEGSKSLQFSHPSGVAVNTTNGMVYVVDKENHFVQILNSDLTFSSVFGEYGQGRGEFREPWSIACDSTGKVYVTDSRNHRIQVFTAEGEFLSMFGKRGHGMGELDCPIGIAVDAGGIVYVSEGGNRRLSVFNSDGRFVKSFGKEGEGPGEFQFPIGLAVDSSGVVYACDWDNHRIQLF
jgi:tripartite motif-containing protein 2/3/tripartite motif-containing protein 71